MNINEQKEYGIHDFYKSRWKKSPVEVLRNMKVPYETYTFFDGDSPEGHLYVYKTDPLTNSIIFAEIGVTDDCPIAEIEIPR